MIEQKGLEEMKLFLKKDFQGITLIELMVAMLIGAVLLAGLFTAFLSQHRSYTVQDQISTIQQSVRAGMDLMVREVRMAGYNPRLSPVTGWAPSPSPWFGILSAGPNAITISFDLDEDGVLDQGENITYSLADFDGDGDDDLVRQEVNVTTTTTLPQLMIENVVNGLSGINESLFDYEILADGREVDYGDRPAAVSDGMDSDGDGFIDFDDPDGDMILTPDPDNYPIGNLGPLGGGDLNGDGAVNDGDRQFFRDAIRNVIITLIVRTEMEDPGYASGLDIHGSAADGTCRTRTLSTRVRVRNLGLGLLPGGVYVSY
ncbi:MAG: prepilin-type N-terminal cleavage/methylation domain-containing protein [Deltaproteobacteria bacterium]|nr:MAG: prepilin-type N-terminal cleavage/methylation domain-containing protein [Deltaproteobacteria bacterium]